MFQALYRVLIELTNGRITSGALKWFSQSKWSRPLISSYIKVYKVNQEDIKREITSFATLHDFFIRGLKDDARKISQEFDVVVSPVDAVLEDVGEISPDKQIIVKDKIYSIEEMLDDSNTYAKYVGGTYMVLYLSPSHYHRIHSPITGKVLKRWVRGRKSYPVNSWGMKYGKQPLLKNYRNITEVEHELGHVAIIKVGAMFVNSIVISDHTEQLQKGKEFAYFSFGSTVVLLFEQGCFKINEELKFPTEVRIGENIGYMVRQK